MTVEITEEMYHQAREVAREIVNTQLAQINERAWAIANEIVRQQRDELWEQEKDAARLADPSDPWEAFQVAYEEEFEDWLQETYLDARAELYDEALRIACKTALQKQVRKISQEPH
jgi:hypothetical protein